MIRAMGRSESDWLDLSTGINPHPWEAPTPPPANWYQLPDLHDGLVEAAAAYYASDAVLPVPGSQSALTMLPWLRGRSRVAVIDPGYSEHAAAWARAGHGVVPLSSPQLSGGARHPAPDGGGVGDEGPWFAGGPRRPQRGGERGASLADALDGVRVGGRVGSGRLRVHAVDCVGRRISVWLPAPETPPKPRQKGPQNRTRSVR